MTKKFVFNLLFVRRLSTQKHCTLSLHEGSNGIYVVKLNKPESKNALDRNMLDMLADIIKKIQSDATSNIVIFRSVVPKVFCSGADLKERLNMPAEQIASHVSYIRTIFQNIYKLSMPTIAALDGVALGGGLELALACDFRIADKNAKFGLVETKLGIIPGAGGTQRLPRIVGIAKAKELIYKGTIISAYEAYKIGLIDEVANNKAKTMNPTDLNDNLQTFPAFYHSLSLAQQLILNNSQFSLRCAKHAIQNGMEKSLEDGLKTEEAEYQKVIYSKDRIEGISAFMEKRKPNYKNQ